MRNSRLRSCLVGLVGSVVVVGLVLWLTWRPLLRMVGVAFPTGEGQEVGLTVPAGVGVQVYARGLGAPRFMAVGPAGTPWAGWLFVAERRTNQVVALPDRDGDGVADARIVVAEGLDRISSLAFYQGALYAGETGQITRLQLNPDGKATERAAVVTDLPPGGAHFTRTVIFGPDGRMYVSIGSSCNVCIEDDPHRAAVWVYPASGGAGEPFSVGLRNAVGLAIHPLSGVVWATNNGRDLLGDELPPETVYALAPGADAGWPRCHAGELPDPSFGTDANACEGVLAPEVKLPAHVAPLGLHFYTPEASASAPLPSDYHGDLFVALHGSWNSSVPVGYKVVRIPIDAGGAVAGPPEDFATGFLLADGRVAGRPVGFETLLDGSLVMSDDHAGVIYRFAGRP